MSKICCFKNCPNTFNWGNNAMPLENAECCNECNSLKVIPARIDAIFNIDKKEKKVRKVSKKKCCIDCENKLTKKDSEYDGLCEECYTIKYHPDFYEEMFGKK